MMSNLKKFRAAPALFLKQSRRKWIIYWKRFRAARAPFFLSNKFPLEKAVYIEKMYTNCGGDVDENGYFASVKRILRWIVGGDVDENGCFI